MAMQIKKKFNNPQLKYDTELIENTAALLLN